MEIKITEQPYNPLLKRKEVTFKIEHEKRKGTPSRLEMRRALAEMFNTGIEMVYVKSLKTKSGSMTADGKANIYDTVEEATVIEPQYIISRNMSKEEKEARKKAETSKKKAEAKEE